MIGSKNKIKKKIKALLAKTTENGASKEEAINALKKASELMKLYLISESDLEESIVNEKRVGGKRNNTFYNSRFYYCKKRISRNGIVNYFN